jgi:hypothetical protein
VAPIRKIYGFHLSAAQIARLYEVCGTFQLGMLGKQDDICAMLDDRFSQVVNLSPITPPNLTPNPGDSAPSQQLRLASRSGGLLVR